MIIAFHYHDYKYYFYFDGVVEITMTMMIMAFASEYVWICGMRAEWRKRLFRIYFTFTAVIIAVHFNLVFAKSSIATVSCTSDLHMLILVLIKIAKITELKIIHQPRIPNVRTLSILFYVFVCGFSCCRHNNHLKLFLNRNKKKLKIEKRQMEFYIYLSILWETTKIESSSLAWRNWFRFSINMYALWMSTQ